MITNDYCRHGHNAICYCHSLAVANKACQRLRGGEYNAYWIFDGMGFIVYSDRLFDCILGGEA